MSCACPEVIFMNRSTVVKLIALLLALVVPAGCLGACSAGSGAAAIFNNGGEADEAEADLEGYAVILDTEPETADFQRTTTSYTIPRNVFDRLVTQQDDGKGNIEIVPSLAESWEVSKDGRTYAFHLREGIQFSNGNYLTASDVKYTFTRLLTYPDTVSHEIAAVIEGAKELEKGETTDFKGIKVLGDLDFTITLEKPFQAFLASLASPAASILDEDTVRAAGDSFGTDPEVTVGTGPFIMQEWEHGKGMLLKANKECWSGAPGVEGLDLRFMEEQEEIRSLFESGGLDIVDLNNVGYYAEYYIHGDIYQNRLYRFPRVAIVYIALNESKKPLNDVRVRKALQLALDRQVILDAVYCGRGELENGIYPHGLYGFDPDLPKIPYDPEEAKSLLSEAGYADGFDLEISVKDSSTQEEKTMMELAATMWKKIGVNAKVNVISNEDFMKRRTTGDLTCFTAMWTADYNDPDNFIYTFFGNEENTTFRSLCYKDEDIMKRVRNARMILDPDKRVKEYQELQKIIVQDDAAWIPLFSRLRFYVTSERVKGVKPQWGGVIDDVYRYIYFDDKKK